MERKKPHNSGGNVFEGALLLWFILTGLSLLYIAYDLLFVTPEAPVMKLGWFLVTLYTGVFGLFFYLLSCKEPMPMTHEQFIKPLWKQSLGSMVHCLAGDVTGIILAAIIVSFISISLSWEITFEYLAGFFFGLLIFQALFMRKIMMQGYGEAVRSSFYPEFVSMNMIMTGMIPAMVLYAAFLPQSADPLSVHFWAKMSIATIVGGLFAYPMNHWLVKKRIKHGMMTVRKEPMQMEEMAMHHKEEVSSKEKLTMLTLSLLCLTFAIVISAILYTHITH